MFASFAALFHRTAVAVGLTDWLEQNSTALWWLFALSIGSLVVTALLLPVVVARLPEDHFCRERSERPSPRSPKQWVVLIGRNALGLVFVLAGIAMLVLPGQGVLTILVGLFLVDFPGKRALERWVVRRRGVLKFLGRMRHKRGQPPLRID